MRLISISRSSVLILASASLVLATAPLVAQTPGLQRTIVQRTDITAPEGEAVMAHVEIAPGVWAGRHTHPGQEMAYVTEGEGELSVEGQNPRKVKAGDSFIVPAGLKHDLHNTGTQTFKVVAFYLVEKGKPLATPAP
jgi:quercetin dioxygenase-like cupin family protein